MGRSSRRTLCLAAVPDTRYGPLSSGRRACQAPSTNARRLGAGRQEKVHSGFPGSHGSRPDEAFAVARPVAHFGDWTGEHDRKWNGAFSKASSSLPRPGRIQRTKGRGSGGSVPGGTLGDAVPQTPWDLSLSCQVRSDGVDQEIRGMAVTAVLGSGLGTKAMNPGVWRQSLQGSFRQINPLFPDGAKENVCHGFGRRRRRCREAVAHEVDYREARCSERIRARPIRLRGARTSWSLPP